MSNWWGDYRNTTPAHIEKQCVRVDFPAALFWMSILYCSLSRINWYCVIVLLSEHPERLIRNGEGSDRKALLLICSTDSIRRVFFIKSKRGLKNEHKQLTYPNFTTMKRMFPPISSGEIFLYKIKKRTQQWTQTAKITKHYKNEIWNEFFHR